MKLCNTCKQEKPKECFSKDRRSKDGLCRKCKECQREYNKQWRETNKENLAIKDAERRRKTAKERNEYSKQWYEENKEHKKAYDKNYHKKNKEEIRIKRQRFYEENKEKIIENNSRYVKQQYKTNETFNLKMRLRHRLREAFRRYSKNGKVGKSKDYNIDWQSIIDYLGPCPGNREDYHIDHIVPICMFDFDKKEEVCKAFAPENHQWLTKEENMKKNRHLMPSKEGGK